MDMKSVCDDISGWNKPSARNTEAPTVIWRK